MHDPDSCTKKLGITREMSSFINGMWKDLSTAEIQTKWWGNYGSLLETTPEMNQIDMQKTEVAGRKPAADVIWYNTHVWDMLFPFPSYFISFKDYPNSLYHLCFSWCKGSQNTTRKKEIIIIGLTFQERNGFSEFNKMHLKDGKMQNCVWPEHTWPYRNENKREHPVPWAEGDKAPAHRQRECCLPWTSLSMVHTE